MYPFWDWLRGTWENIVIKSLREKEAKKARARARKQSPPRIPPAHKANQSYQKQVKMHSHSRR